ncbi:histidine kinase [Sideroxydans lithotrophicus]|uniref:histidine kinase n=1 Tax=Sideroxydans lithotrophicus (strain ES-1) TaxID=580332 RepID=D5CUK9_SIDLE|nr:histidine kinase [Sideroxydans lithotrophicus]ADE12396.1 integral membrane sensor signal transduction histidine kinase [Sideroxydans lithotrophicus ES-1]
MKYSRTQIVLAAIVLIAAWSLSAWFIADQYYLAQVKIALDQKTKISRDIAVDLSDSIQRNLSFIAGVPDLLAQSERVKKTVSRFGTNSTPSSLPLEVRKRRWTNDPMLRSLSLYLHQVQGNLHVDLIYMVDAAGDCIVAGNIDTPGSSIGTNFAERDFVHANRNGDRGMQYAVGKTTHIPGLFFASPIFIEGRYMGSVVAKNDVPNLTSMIKQVSAFVTDANGVIILANEKSREMSVLPGAPIEGLSAKEKFDRYRRNDFPVLRIEPWEDSRFASLSRVQDDIDPHIILSKVIPEYGIKIHVDTDIAEFHILNRDKLWFAVLLGMAGSILILIASGTYLYVDSLKTAEIALKRASIAERRIINVTEETQERIGRELHDDLGQQLTGTAFRAELLSQDLKKQGNPEYQEAAKITTMINEAIDKTRNLAQGLYPVELKGAGLHAMLAQIAANVVSIYHIECELIGEAESSISNQHVLINLFRITQEAVNNAIKHSGATRITLRMAETPQRMELEIADNGCGISKRAAADSNKGLGMHTMYYRASLLGAAFHIAERPEGGTSVTVVLPMRR